MTTPGKFPLHFRHARLQSVIQEGLADVENLLHASVKSDLPLLDEVSHHLITAGGKRFRPALTLLAAEFGDRDAPAVVKAAAAVELTHLATLHHDDVMDEALVRRGVASVNARWGNRMAVRSGDFLLARATQLAVSLGSDVLQSHGGVLRRLVRGQALEVNGPREGQDPVEHYFEVIADKTGALVAAATRFGALLAGADGHTVRLMDEFGERIGVAFQLADDILDISGEVGEFGKRIGTDLRRGVPTLPVLLIRSTSPVAGDATDSRLRLLLQEDLTDDTRHAEALHLIRRHPAFAEARARTLRQAESARDLLAHLRRNPARTVLEDLCTAVIERIA
ncbi:polyprenyl synthetase family protein [Actinacidiphila sp. bgisy167]|uniref:polyprenyl synthetase family protein n=1 Tax=Actinacidiphila sp. bgisy167 TaxID=3413797 RepID=UPI003D7135B6